MKHNKLFAELFFQMYFCFNELLNSFLKYKLSLPRSMKNVRSCSLVSTLSRPRSVTLVLAIFSVTSPDTQVLSCSKQKSSKFVPSTLR